MSKQQQALTALYHASDGPSWLKKSNWLDNSVSYCEWYGVTCSQNNDVQALDLGSNGLKGTLSSELSALTELQVLLLSNSAISGTLTSELFGNWTRLQRLFGFSNSFSGSIPQQVAELSHLHQLFVQSNHLSGTVPSLAGSPLIKMALYNNNLQGRLALPNHSGLESVLVQNNRFSCQLEANYSEQTNSISNSSLVLPGETPRTFCHLLIVWCATGNAFSNPLPKWLPMYTVSFLSVPETFRDAWGLQVLEVASGIAALTAIAAVLTRGKVRRYFWFSPQQPLEHLLVSCSKVLAYWSLVVVVILVPLYVVGAEYVGESNLQDASSV